MASHEGARERLQSNIAPEELPNGFERGDSEWVHAHARPSHGGGTGSNPVCAFIRKPCKSGDFSLLTPSERKSHNSPHKEVAGSHAIYVSQPAAVAELIETAIDATVQAPVSA